MPMPIDGPHVPEKSTYIEEFNEILKKLSTCRGFSTEDEDYGYEKNAGVILFRFSKNVVEKIIRPELENSKRPEKQCHIAKSFHKVEILADGTVKVTGASDSIHAIYVAIAIYAATSLPKSSRKKLTRPKERTNTRKK